MAVDFEAVTQLCRQYADNVRRSMPVDKVVLFGSYAKGTADERSDVDTCFFLDNYGGKGRREINLRRLALVDGGLRWRLL